MITFTGKTFAQCYEESLRYLLDNGIVNNARGTTSNELLDVALVVEDPTQCLYSNPARGSQTKYIAAEFLWYYMGRNDVAFILVCIYQKLVEINTVPQLVKVFLPN